MEFECAADGVVHLFGGTCMYEVREMLLNVKFFGNSLRVKVLDGETEWQMLPLQPESMDVLAFLLLETRPQAKNGIRNCNGLRYSPVTRLEVYNAFWSGKSLTDASKATRLLLDDIDEAAGFSRGTHRLFEFSTEGFYPKVEIRSDFNDYENVCRRTKSGETKDLLDQVFMFLQIQQLGGFLRGNHSRWALNVREDINIEAARAIVKLTSQIGDPDEMWDKLREDAFRLNPRLRV